MESPSECGIEPTGSISHRISLYKQGHNWRQPMACDKQSAGSFTKYTTGQNKAKENCHSDPTYHIKSFLERKPYERASNRTRDLVSRKSRYYLAERAYTENINYNYAYYN